VIFQYGSIPFADNSCTPVLLAARTIYSERAKPLMLRKHLVVSGEIIATGQVAIGIQVIAIQNALSLDGGDAFFRPSDSFGPQLGLFNTNSLAGVRVIERPSFTAQDGRAHWATGLPYHMAFEADYPAATDGIVSYKEEISTTGNNGGPRQVCLELDVGLPVIQTASESTPIIVLQSGEINGFLGYAAVNDPIFPNAILAPEDKQITETAPLAYGNAYTNFNRRWSYRMTLTTPGSIPSPLRR
jgi:hypothetical protein